MGRSAQRKGADGERELANILREHGYPVQRGGSLTYGAVPDLTGLPGVHIEVKRRERMELAEWMKQAEGRAGRRALWGRRSYRVSSALPLAVAGDNEAGGLDKAIPREGQ